MESFLIVKIRIKIKYNNSPFCTICALISFNVLCTYPRIKSKANYINNTNEIKDSVSKKNTIHHGFDVR